MVTWYVIKELRHKDRPATTSSAGWPSYGGALRLPYHSRDFGGGAGHTCHTLSRWWSGQRRSLLWHGSAA
jgi:hypothetical protein